MAYFQFIVSAGLIVFAGSKLTKQADILSERLGLGKVWIGLVLLGVVTSLPEGITSLTAVISLKANDLAVGNMLGSNNFNLMLVVFMDILYRRGSVTNAIGCKSSIAMPGLCSMAMALIVLLSLFDVSFGYSLSIWRLSAGSILIMAIYVYAIVQGRRDDLKSSLEGIIAGEASAAGISLKKLSLHLVLSALVVVLGSIWLTNSAEVIAEVSGLGQNFVGTFLLALATSLPEMVVTFSAIKIGVLDLALGNIFGSNMINLFILFLCDLFYRKPLFVSVSGVHMITSGVCILLTLTALWGLTNSKKRVVLGLGVDSWAMTILFCFGLISIYYFK